VDGVAAREAVAGLIVPAEVGAVEDAASEAEASEVAAVSGGRKFCN